jgi:L-lactate dehydrogenase
MAAEAVNLRRIAIVGAGSVGATSAYACQIRGICDAIALYDLDAGKVEAQVRDLQHGGPFAPTVEITGGDDIALCAGAQVIVITAGAKQRPGESRLALTQRNSRLLRELIPPLLKVNSTAALLLVTNPVDVLTYGALKLSGLSRAKVLGSGTVLDSVRFRALIAARIKVAPKHVHAYIAGEHGDSEIPLWSSAAVGSVPLRDWAVQGHGRLDVRARTEITQKVKNAAAEIVAGKGATWFAIGLCVAEIVEALFDDVSHVMPVSALIEEADGIEGVADVCLSLPRLVSRCSIEPPLPVPMNENEKAGLQNCAQVVKDAIRQAGF